MMNALFPLTALACSYNYPAPELPLSASSSYSQGADGDVQRLFSAIATLLSRESGCSFTPQALPNARRDMMFNNGQLLFELMVLQVNSERLPAAEFIPLIRLPVRLTILDSSPHVSAEALLAAPGTRIGILHGTHIPPAMMQLLRQHDVLSRLEPSHDRKSLYLKLQRQRIDAVLDFDSWSPTSVPALDSHLKRLGLTPPLYVSYGSYLSNKMPVADRQAIRRALQRIGQDGSVLKLTGHFFPAAAPNLRLP